MNNSTRRSFHAVEQAQLASLFPEDMVHDDELPDDDGLLTLPDPTEVAHSARSHRMSAAAALRGTKSAGQAHDSSSHTLVLQVGNLASPLERTQVQLKPQVREALGIAAVAFFPH